MIDQWRTSLREFRRQVGMTQSQVAEAAGVSVETVRAYETGRKHAGREFLAAILDVLRVPRDERNMVLLGAGFAPDGHSLGHDYPRGMFLPDEAVAHVESLPWPAFVLDEYMKILGANRVAQRLWRVDLDREFLGDVERNFLSVASDPRFADCCLNWNDAVRDLLAVFKGKDSGPDDLDNPSPYFRAVIDKFLAGDPQYVTRLVDLWRQAEPVWDRKMRWTYRIDWQDSRFSEPLHFMCLATPAHHGDATAFGDWIPGDASTWAALGQMTDTS